MVFLEVRQMGNLLNSSSNCISKKPRSTQKSKLNHKDRKSWSKSWKINFKTWASLQSQNHFSGEGARSTWYRTSVHCVNIRLLICLPSSPKVNYIQPLIRETVHCGKINNQNTQRIVDTGSELSLISGNQNYNCHLSPSEYWIKEVRLSM